MISSQTVVALIFGPETVWSRDQSVANIPKYITSLYSLLIGLKKPRRRVPSFVKPLNHRISRCHLKRKNNDIQAREEFEVFIFVLVVDDDGLEAGALLIFECDCDHLIH